MSGQAKGSFESRVLTDGSKSFHLRFQLAGKRATVVLHERPGCRAAAAAAGRKQPREPS
jgi:hypothetical protein